MAGDYFEEIRQQQMDAAISLLKRKVNAGEFPENEDTIKAFAAGWYGVREFDHAKQTKQETGITAYRFAIAALIFGSYLLGFLGLALYYGIPLRYSLWSFFAGAAVFYTIAYFLVRRSRWSAENARRDFDSKWTPLAINNLQEATLTVDD